MKETNQPKLDVYLPWLVIVFSITGLLIGRFSTEFGPSLEWWIPYGLFLMILPSMIMVDLTEIAHALKDKKKCLLSSFFNYCINPFVVLLLARLFLSHNENLYTGWILVGIAPDIDLLLLWTFLARGNNSLSIMLVAINALLSVFTVPLFIHLFLGSNVSYDQLLVFRSILIYLILPLIIGVALRRMLTSKLGERGLRAAKPYLFVTRNFGMISTLIVLFALKGHIILDNPGWVLLMALPISIFLCFTFSMVFLTSRFFRFNYEDSVAIAFNGTGRNYELSTAIALSAFGPNVAVATIIYPLIDINVMFFIVGKVRKCGETALAEDRVPARLGYPVLRFFHAIRQGISTRERSWKDACDLADVSLRMDRPDLAMEHYTAFASEHPSDPAANLEIAKLHERLRDNDSALRHLYRSLDAQPNNGEIHFRIGKLLFERQEYAEALPHVIKAASLRHQAADAYQLAGSAQHELGKIDEAIVCYLKAVALDSSCKGKCYRILALLHEKTGRMDEAALYYKWAIKDSRGKMAGKAS
ncbi:MAG TPA: bile acid:sodium symporter [Syntrophales bacterium]|nr:bile acid:sodium symporter [Syntrophales bacterium]